MTLCAITGTARLLDNTLLIGATILLRRNPTEVIGAGGTFFVPEPKRVVTDGSGGVSFSLESGPYIGLVSTSYGEVAFAFNVPDAGSAAFADCLTVITEATYTAAELAVLAASGLITYTTTGEGIAATTEGQFFMVPAAPMGLAIYENVAGVATLRGGLLLQQMLSDGSFGAPALAFAADTDTGFFRPSADAVGVAGKLGVGPTIPRGNISINQATAASLTPLSLHMGYGPVDYCGFRFLQEQQAVMDAAGKLRIQRGDVTQWLDALVIDNVGRVGIGVASPSYRVDIWGAAGSNAGVQLLETTSGTEKRLIVTQEVAAAVYNATFGSGGNAHVFQTGNLERMRITSDGRVGIGASNPSGTLHISNFGAQGIEVYPGFSTTVNLTQHYDRAASVYLTHIVDGADHRFACAGTERMRITPGGSLLIGQTSDPVSVRLGVTYAGGSTQYGMSFRPLADNTIPIVFLNAAGTYVGSIDTSATTTSYLTASDRRMKENIAPAPDAGVVIDAIQIVSHDWKAGGSHVAHGVIAQDLAQVVPAAVTRGDDGDEVERAWAVDYSKLVPLLVKEIQSLRARVAAMEGGAQ
jgi:hypothetical protein